MNEFYRIEVHLKNSGREIVKGTLSVLASSTTANGGVIACVCVCVCCVLFKMRSPPRHCDRQEGECLLVASPEDGNEQPNGFLPDIRIDRIENNGEFSAAFFMRASSVGSRRLLVRVSERSLPHCPYRLHADRNALGSL